MRIVRRVLLAALVVGVLFIGWRFAALNATPVAVDLLVVRSAEISLWIALIVAFGLGASAAAALSLFEIARRSLVSRRYRKTVARLEAEIHQLRNLPLAGEEPLPGAAAQRER